MTARGLPNPQRVARIGGVLYLVIIIIGLCGETMIRNQLVAAGDPSATAERLRAGEFLWRLGIAGEFVLLTCGTALALVFYILFKPVNREIALLAVFFNLVTIAVEAVAALHLQATLMPLGKAAYLQALDPKQLEVLAYLSIRSHGQGFGASLIFFACTCLALGWLIVKSGFLPKTIGVLMAIAGVCYLVNSFSLILAPSLANVLFPAILAPVFVAEASLCLWLLLKGVDEARWQARAAAMAPA